MNFTKEYLRKALMTLVAMSLLMAGLNSEAYASQKRALLIGIGNYPAESGWGPTNSVNDVKAMKSSLRLQDFSDTRELLDEKATKQGVINELNKLYSACQAGDVVVFYYSGHGQFVQDQNGDEFDRFDEALVLYGAPRSYDPVYQNEHHLLDEELSKIMNQMRLKLRIRFWLA
ncbi:MAG: caspase family protein [Bacteroidia bacterium]|nr:caspase family protein [Bacteroidia bacterium]